MRGVASIALSAAAITWSNVVLPAFGLSPRARAVVNTAAVCRLSASYSHVVTPARNSAWRTPAFVVVLSSAEPRRGRSSPATASLWPFPPCARLSLPTSEQTAAKTSSNGSSCTSRSDGALRGTVVP